LKEIKDMNIGELAAYVSSHLFKNNIKCVLSGGACVSIYSINVYQSYDLDFIELYYVERKKLKSVMAEIDFIEENRYFKHNDTRFFIEFPSGPLAIGSEQVRDINEMDFETGKLYLLSPTDCVKDRLSAYYFWDDHQSLEQAILVAKHNKIDIPEIRRWSGVEQNLKKFNQFLKRIS
jgi:hypothetical protein